MNDEASSTDSLSIPLEKSLKRIREDSRINVKNLRGPVLMLLFVISLFYLYANAKSATPIAPLLFLLLLLLIIWSTWRKITCARKLLQLYDGAAVPPLTLDSQGFICPAVILNYAVCNRLLGSGQSSVQIKWENVGYFWDKKSSHPTKGTPMPGMYMMRLKRQGIAPKLKGIVLQKEDLSAEEQDKFIGFVQRFLSVPIKTT